MKKKKNLILKKNVKWSFIGDYSTISKSVLPTALILSFLLSIFGLLSTCFQIDCFDGLVASFSVVVLMLFIVLGMGMISLIKREVTYEEVKK